MLWKVSVVPALVALAALYACQKDGTGEGDKQEQEQEKEEPTPENPTGPGTIAVSGGSVDIMKSAMGSMPTIKEAGASNPGTLAIGLVDDASDAGQLPLSLLLDEPTAVVGSAINSPQLQRLFAFECFMENSGGIDGRNCPPKILEEIRANPTNSRYRYGSYSLLGMLASAGNPAMDTTEYESTGVPGSSVIPITTTAATFRFLSTQDVAGNPISEADGSTWILPHAGMFNAANRMISSNSPGRVVLTAYNRSPVSDGRVFVVRSTKIPATGGRTQNEAYETYLSLGGESKKTPRVLGYNQVLFNGYMGECSACSRAILLINFETNRFLLKMGSAYSSVVAAGAGGFDFTTNTWKDGAYFARSRWQSPPPGTQWNGCVDNKTQTVLSLDTSHERCQGDLETFFANSGSLASGDYLDLTAQEKSDLSAYLAFFADDDPLPASAVPSNIADVSKLPDTVGN